MNKSNKIMIFGAGMLQVSLIKTAIELGFYTIVVDPDPMAVGKNIADEFVVVAGNDMEKTLEIARANKVKGLVTAATDKPLLMMATIASILHLPFPTKEAIENTINKYELKKILLKNNIPCARGVLSDLSDLDDNLIQTGLTFPAIIKPIDSSGSRGVFFCTTKDEITDAYSDCIKYSNFDKILIEEYLEGPEISIEALVQEDNLYVIQITDKTVSPFPYNVEMGHLQPSRFHSEHGDEIYQILKNAVKALKLNNCALHPEMKITKDGIKIVEIGPRLGGDFITSHLTPLSTGINLEEQLLKIAIGEKINIKNTSNKYSAVLYFDLSDQNINEDLFLLKIKSLETYISGFQIYYSDLNNLPVITNSLERHGHVIFSATSLEKILTIKDLLIKGLYSQ